MTFKEFVVRGHFIYFFRCWLYEQYMDRRIGGKSLSGMRDNHDFQGGQVDKEWHPVQSTDYRILREVIPYIKVSPNDIFVDVGCGCGRMISYMILKGNDCEYIGVDINREAAETARKRFIRYPNVHIETNNILSYFPEKGTVFFLSNPFGADILDQFLLKAESILKHRVILYYIIAEHTDVFEVHKEWKKLNDITLHPRYYNPIRLCIYEYTA